jgi:acetyl-CoA carboxylase biotin carboxyl carrier protein
MDNGHLLEVMKLFSEANITKLELKNGDFSINLEKNFMSVTEIPVHTTTVQTPKVTQIQQEVVEVAIQKAIIPEGDYIKSPMVGTFYRSPSPSSPVFVEVGSIVKQGAKVAIIEAMKIMNEIEAEFDCKIVEILVNDGMPVDYDMKLFRVERV